MELVQHKYPDNIKILNDPYLTHLTAMASTAECAQPRFNQLITRIFSQLFISIMNNEWPKTSTKLKTRMAELHPECFLDTTLFNQDQRGICVDVARAGMLPSQLFFDELNQLVNPSGIRNDHIFASRTTNAKGEVTGTEFSGSKIGGDVEDAILFIPDPMGATGGSLCEVVSHYKEKIDGKIKKIISAHMIITPEFVKNITDTHPEVIVYSARLDRGFSTPEALSKQPGELWEQEKGLNDSQYIVPGAGGVGELINNSFV